MKPLYCALFFLFFARYCHGKWTVTATGRVTCYGEPMPQVKIILRDKDLIFDDNMGSTRASYAGTFSVTGKGMAFLLCSCLQRVHAMVFKVTGPFGAKKSRRFFYEKLFTSHNSWGFKGVLYSFNVVEQNLLPY